MAQFFPAEDMDTTIDQLYKDLHDAFVLVNKYTFDDDATSLKINSFYEKIESDISELEFLQLPTLPNNPIRKSAEFQLFKIKERYNDLQSSFRTKKVQEKQKHLDLLYIKSFDKSELLIESGRFEEAVAIEAHNFESLNDEKLEELTSQEKLLQQNSVLTGKLQNVNNMLKSTLLAGELNLNDLDHSTKSLSELSDSYQMFGSILNKTNTLVKEINKASKQERIMIYRSIYFFLSVCCWILWRRIFKRPILLLIWLILSPLKLIFNRKKSAPINSSSISMTSSILETTAALTTETVLHVVETTLTKDEV